MVMDPFAGHMLINWYLSEFSEDEQVNSVNGQELRVLAMQFCTHLLAAGVLRQIPDKDVPMYSIFKVKYNFNVNVHNNYINVNFLRFFKISI